MTGSAMISGTCDERFARVRDVFEANFESGAEVGASFAATVEGSFVVDLWGGHKDAARTRPWERDTIVNVWSTTKAMITTCVHMLVDRKLLDLDAPVAKYWPEFAQAGKADVPVRYILSHKAGLPVIRERLPTEAFYDWERVVTAIAAQKPTWEPGTKHGYHAMTFGYLVGEIVRRITGKTIGAFFREEVAMPLGADFHIGLDEWDDKRVAEMIPPVISSSEAANPESALSQMITSPRVRPDVPNTRAWRAAEIPAANGHGNARSIGRVMAALACWGQIGNVYLMRESTLRNAIEEQASGPDLVLGIPMRWGLGYMLASEDTAWTAPNPNTFGHAGWGGSVAVADMDAQVSWAYVMNKMDVGTTGDIRSQRLSKALYDSLE